MSTMIGQVDDLHDDPRFDALARAYPRISLIAARMAKIISQTPDAWDPTNPTKQSNYLGAFTTQITVLPTGIVDPTPAQIQAYFGCPTMSATTPIGSCTDLANDIQTSNSAEFTATLTPVPEPGTFVLFVFGLAMLGVLRCKLTRGLPQF